MSLRDISRDVPIDGLIVATAKGDWIIRVERVEDPAADNTRWTFHLRLEGSTTLRLMLVVASETLFVEHSAGDSTWIVQSVRLWLMQPDIERREELWLTPPPTTS